MLINSIFPDLTVFSTLSQGEIIFSATFNLSSANALNLDQSKNFLFGKELAGKHGLILLADTLNTPLDRVWLMNILFRAN